MEMFVSKSGTVKRKVLKKRKSTTTVKPSNSTYTYTCVIQSCDDDDDKNFPMYVAMSGLCVTPTGFGNVMERDALCNKIKVMSGEVSLSYSSRTTHLLAAHANTTKVVIARRRKAVIVTAEWVNEIWDACQNNNPYVHASFSCFAMKEVPLLYNLHFRFSNRFDKETLAFYETLIKKAGGKLTLNLEKSPEYFYICQVPENGKVYQDAQGKGIPCLSLGWISDSIETNQLAAIQPYEVRSTDVAGFGMTFDICEDKRDVGDNEMLIQFDEIMEEDVFESEDNSNRSSKPDLDLQEASLRKERRRRRTTTFSFESSSQPRDENGGEEGEENSASDSDDSNSTIIDGSRGDYDVDWKQIESRSDNNEEEIVTSVGA